MERYWLWVWLPHKKEKVKSGWGFDTKEEAEKYYNRHFRDGNLEMEITYEDC